MRFPKVIIEPFGYTGMPTLHPMITNAELESRVYQIAKLIRHSPPEAIAATVEIHAQALGATEVECIYAGDEAGFQWYMFNYIPAGGTKKLHQQFTLP